MNEFTKSNNLHGIKHFAVFYNPLGICVNQFSVVPIVSLV